METEKRKSVTSVPLATLDYDSIPADPRRNRIHEQRRTTEA